MRRRQTLQDAGGPPATPPARRLALFDLDHTLIPFDSGMAWLRFLIAREHLPAHTEADYLAACQRYVDGLADIHALHHALVSPLQAVERGALQGWLAAFEAAVPTSLPAPSLALVRAHLDAGDRCVLVTATTRFIAERYAAAFGIPEVLASEALADSHGPAHRPHRRAAVRRAAQVDEAAGVAAV